MPDRSKQRPISLWVAGLFLMSFLAVALAGGLEIEGLWRARQERLEREWPAVMATVLRSYLDPYYPFQRDGGGVIYNVRCRFQYSVNGAGYQSAVKIIGKRHSIPSGLELPPDALRMKAWAARHRKGSPETIHYDPANPASISLAGDGDDLRTNTAAIALASVKPAGILGVLLFLIAWLARRSRSAARDRDAVAGG